MGILRSDRVSGLGGANAINGSVDFSGRSGPSFLRTISDDFAVGTGDFTLEAWYYRSAEGSHADAVGNIIVQTGSTATSQNGMWLADAQGKLEGRVHYGSGSWNLDITSSTTMSDNTWYHVAMSRSGSAVKIFIDGALEASGSSSSDLTTAYSNEAYVGGQGNSPGNRGVNGYISNARISNTALYTAAFTVPTARLDKLSSTILLCCQSPGNVLKEETGKSLIVYKNNIKDAGPVASNFAPDVGEDHGTTFEDNTKFDTLSYMVPPGGTTEQRGRGRAVIGWANNPVNTGMDYFSIQSMGNSISFGTLTSGNRWGSHALSSSTRGLFVGGYINTPAATYFNTIDYVTIATTSNPIDFGDVTTASYRSGCCSSSTRGIIALGYIAPASGKVNTIDYVTIASTGNATNFGDLFQTRGDMSSLSSPTRGVFAGGTTPTYVNTIDYVTIATTGDASNFGDLNYTPISSMAMASTTRGIIGGGYPSPANTNIIDFITIASTGNATNFGDLTGLYSVGSATSNSIRGVFCGGYTSPSKHNLMEFVTIATTGNASDFGDMLYSRRDFGACSDSHGGIS